jgi:hypothetical protein
MNVFHCSHLFSTADGFLKGISHISFSATALNEHFLLNFVLDNANCLNHRHLVSYPSTSTEMYYCSEGQRGVSQPRQPGFPGIQLHTTNIDAKDDLKLGDAV